MRFFQAVGVLVACGLAVAAPVPKEKDKPKKDGDAIQAVWRLETMEVNGMTLEAGAEMMRFAFADGKLKLTLLGKPKEQDATYKLDPTAAPKTIDIDEGKGRTSLGIYDLDGDTLRICLAEGKAPVRPTEFKGAGKAVCVFTLRRVADEKKDK